MLNCLSVTRDRLRVQGVRVKINHVASSRGEVEIRAKASRLPLFHALGRATSSFLFAFLIYSRPAIKSTMAEPVPNGTPITGEDVEMKEEAAPDVCRPSRSLS